jgi:putative peptidoglycan lipid II flippase
VPAAASLSTFRPTSISLRALRDSAASLLQRILRHPMTRATAGFAASTAVVKAVAFVKEAVVAAAFGVGSSMDSYLMALVVIGFPAGVLLNAAQTVFVREYVRAVEVNGEAAASRFLRAAMLGLLLAMSTLLVVWIVALPTILSVVGHGLAPAQRALVSANVHRLVPYYYLNGINLLAYGVLQSRNAFQRAALIPIATPIFTMAVVAAAGTKDLDVLIGALTLGTGVETALIFILMTRARARRADAATRASYGLKELAWGTLTLMPGTLVAGLSPVIEQTIASGLGHGAISALGYAAKLPATLNSLLATAVGVTILPYFSQRLSRGDDAGTRRFFIRYAAILTLVGLLISALAVLGSEPFVRIAFQRGVFSPQNTLVVTALQRAYLWQVPGALVGTVATRFIAAQGRYRVMTMGALLMVPITGLAQWGLAAAFGAAGLALGTSVGAALSATVLFWLALRPPVESARGREAE